MTDVLLVEDVWADTFDERFRGLTVRRSPVAARADLVAGTRALRMLDAAAFARMRPGTVLISVGRGEVVDEDALAGALRSGQLAGAGLDVRALEPPRAGPLDDAPNVIFTPHVAGITVESQHRIATILAEDITAVLSGGTASHAVGAHRSAR